MNARSAEQQEDSRRQHDFVLHNPTSSHHGVVNHDTITVGPDGMAAGKPACTTKPRGIPGRRGRLWPGSARPWKVKLSRYQ